MNRNDLSESNIIKLGKRLYYNYVEKLSKQIEHFTDDRRKNVCHMIISLCILNWCHIAGTATNLNYLDLFNKFFP